MTEKRHETYLLTPGPLTTARETREAMLFDKSPNSPEMVEMVKGIRQYLVSLTGGEGDYECVPLQGSATYGIEAAFLTLVDKATSKTLVVENGFYGVRLREGIEALGHNVIGLECPVIPPVSSGDIRVALDSDPDITHLAICHCDTGTGVLNPLEGIADLCKERGIN